MKEYRFKADLKNVDLDRLRRALVDAAGGFTEVAGGEERLFIVGIGSAASSRRLRSVLARWAPRGSGVQRLRRPSAQQDREAYFLLPLLRNPDRSEQPRRPLFTNEQLNRLRSKLADIFGFRPQMVYVYGEWRNDEGEVVPDQSVMIHVHLARSGTLARLRKFIRKEILGDPSCDQDCIYLSCRWQGEYVRAR